MIKQKEQEMTEKEWEELDVQLWVFLDELKRSEYWHPSHIEEDVQP
jgi:hypothetical protein